MTEDGIRVRHPSLDEEGNDVVLRGIIDRTDLQKLRVDFYQREKLTISTRREIRRALEEGGKLPDITLGMRGQLFTMDGPDVVLLNPVFIIDGLQRVKTVEELHVLQCTNNISLPLRLGAIIYFGTNVKWEREQFHALNAFQSKVSPNVLLRNIKDENPLLATLYGLSKSDRNSIIYGRVCWSQNMNRGELLTATTMLSTVLRLHNHLGISPHRMLKHLEDNAQRLIDKVGMPLARENTKTLFNLIDECWGLRKVQSRGSVPYIKSTFLQVLARLLSDHTDFWKQPEERRLVIPRELRAKLAKFDIQDPEVVRLAGGSGKALMALYFILKTHVNSGKRTKRLTARHGGALLEMDDTPRLSEEPEEDEEEVA